MIKKIKDQLPKGYGVVLLKKGLEEEKIGEMKEIETRGRELACLCAGAAQSGYLEEGYRIMVIINNGNGFEVFEYTHRHWRGEERLPFDREYHSNFFL